MKLRSLGILAGLAIIALTACNKTDLPVDDSIEGRYIGTLTKEGTKSANESTENSVEATAEVSITGENEIQVNCYTSDFDTTFMLNYYEHYDSAYVCFTGADFEEMYGHMPGGGHMMGGMMGDITHGETEWMHHMSEEHDDGDQHFGGFDMANHSFSYTFQMNKSDSSDDLHFQGIKQ